MQETQEKRVRFLSREHPLEQETSTQEPGRLYSSQARKELGTTEVTEHAVTLNCSRAQ